MRENKENKTPDELIDEIKRILTTHLETFSRYKRSPDDPQKISAGDLTAHLEKQPDHTRNIIRDELAARMDYDTRLEAAKQLLIKAMESLAEARMANNAGNAGIVDTFRANLQIIHRLLPDLETAMKNIADWHTRFGNGRTTLPGPSDAGG